jgi:beta-lactamase class A
LSDAVREALATHQGTIGVVVTRLDGSAATEVNADRRFRTASLYKLWILSTAMAAIESGGLDPDETLTISAALVAADPFSDFLTGTEITVDCALRTMIEMSGNSAADVLEQRLGLAAINAHMRALGLQQSTLSADTAVTTPRDMATLLGTIGRGEAVTPAASQRMLDLLTNQQQNDRVPAPLPLNMRVAHKTGEQPGLRHDAALVFAPSGAYVLAALVQDAPDEAAARSTIVDVSRAVYAALEPGGPPLYLGLPPRLARQAFRLPEAQGRLALLSDPRAETIKLANAGFDEAGDARLRPEVVADLVALRDAAQAAGHPLAIQSGFLRPTQAEAERALPIAWLQPCALSQPPLTADIKVKDEPPSGVQHWLGTVVTFKDDADSWLLDHAADFGFVPSLPEAGTSGPREPSTWRWVGRPMAARIRPAFGAPDYPARLRSELERALAELNAPEPTIWGQAGQCWTIPSVTGRGCASRWYFLPLPGF